MAVTNGQTLTLRRGSTWDKQLTWTDQDGDAVSLSGSPKAWFVIKASVTTADADSLSVATYGSPSTPTATTGTSMSILDAAAGTMRWQITEAATATYTAGQYWWAAQLLTDGGHLEEQSGPCVIDPDFITAVT
jgi:hypothetical protein